MKSSDRFDVSGVSCSLHGRVLPVVNLSMGGLFAATEDPPAPGQVVDLQLDIGERPPFRVRGLVAWINPAGGRRARALPHGFGVKITQIAFPDKLALLGVLRRVEAEHSRRALVAE